MADETWKSVSTKVFTIDDKVPKPDNVAVGFEEALEKTGFGCYNYILYAVSNVVLMAMALETFGTSYVVTAAACDLQLTTETKGLISAMPMLGIVVSSHLWGWLADTRGRRAVLMLSMAGSFLCGFTASWATHWVMLACLKFAAAFFASASNAVVYALFGECTPRARRDKQVMLMSSGLMFSQGIMTLNAYPILELNFSYELAEGLRYRPWRLLQQAYSAWSGLAALLLLLVVVESPKFYVSQGREEESLKVLRKIFARNTGRKQEEYPVKSLSFHEQASSTQTNVLRNMWEQTVPLLKPPLLFKTLVITYIVIIVYATSPAFLMWTPTIMNAFSRATAMGAHDITFCQLLHMDLTANASNTTTDLVSPVCKDKVENLTYIALFIFSSATALTNLCNAFLVKFVGKRALVIFLHLLGGVSAFLLPWLYNAYASLLIFFLFQANIVAMALTTGFTVEVYPTYLRAMAVCLTMMVGRGSSSLSISYVGVLLERHCDGTFFGFGLLILSGALVALLLPSEQKRDRDKPTKA